nr:hypothetical protein [Thermodesulfatator atlanticus]
MKKRQFSPEEKLAIVLEGLKGQKSVAISAGNIKYPSRCFTAGETSSWKVVRMPWLMGLLLKKKHTSGLRSRNSKG